MLKFAVSVKTWRKKILFGIVLIVISGILTFVVGEVAVRLLKPQKGLMRWFAPSDRYGFIMKPNFSGDLRFPKPNFTMEVRINSHGHRFPEYDTTQFKDDSFTKILLLGDSFMFGHGVNIGDQVGYRLDKLLAASGRKFAVINSGVGGWGTLQQTTYARDHFDVFNPDIVVLLFCGNDPDDDIRFEAKIGYDERGYLRLPGKAFLRNHSHLYRFMAREFHKVVHNITLKRKSKEDGNAAVDQQSASLIIESQWQKTGAALERFYQDLRQANPAARILLMATAPWEENNRESLQSIATDAGVEYVDLYEETVDLTKEQRQMPHDGHWSVRLHELSAETLAEAILAEEGE